MGVEVEEFCWVGNGNNVGLIDGFEWFLNDVKGVDGDCVD